jgi:N-acetyl-gamma-glutamyl-phosphate reductase
MHIYSELKNSTLNVAIIGARGYSGAELCRGLLIHPGIKSIALGLNEQNFEIEQLIPENITKPVQKKTVKQLLEEAGNFDLFFLATPAEVSMELAPQLLEAQTRVIDLSGAFRLSTKAAYQQWYNINHQATDLLDVAQYGLIPFHSNLKKDSSLKNDISFNKETKSSNDSSLKKDTYPLIANPGCYATSVLMALVPLLNAKVIDPNFIVIDAKSGTTGAGKKAAENLLFTEVEGECLPYRIAKHQHYPEICEHILNLTGQNIDPLFSTTLIPVRRGIIAGIYTRLQKGLTEQDLAAAYNKAYENYPLVKVAQANKAPNLLSLKRVVGSARTHIAYVVDESTKSDSGKKLYIYSSIDNLMKGAASQAIENMNHLWGWPVETGLLNREGVL